jgi:hypothetical protein
MPVQISQEGSFRGLITEYGLYEPDSGAVGVNIRARITEAWDSDSLTWEDWAEYDMEAEGCVWLVQRKDKGGGINQKSVDSLIRFAGWNGDIQSIVNGGWEPVMCAFAVTKETYKENTRFRIAFINDPDRIPGGQGNVTPERAKELQTLYGAQFRALAGNTTRNAAPPQGKPGAKKGPIGGKAPATAPATKPAPAKRPPMDQSPKSAPKTIDEVNAELQAAGGGDDIPFSFWWVLPWIGLVAASMGC